MVGYRQPSMVVVQCLTLDTIPRDHRSPCLVYTFSERLISNHIQSYAIHKNEPLNTRLWAGLTTTQMIVVCQYRRCDALISSIAFLQIVL